MPPKLNLIQAAKIGAGSVDEPDFVKKSKGSGAPEFQTMQSSVHPSASLETFEPSDDEGSGTATKKKKKSNKGMLIAGAAAIAVLALKK